MTNRQKDTKMIIQTLIENKLKTNGTKTGEHNTDNKRLSNIIWKGNTILLHMWH